MPWAARKQILEYLVSNLTLFVRQAQGRAEDPDSGKPFQANKQGRGLHQDLHKRRGSARLSQPGADSAGRGCPSKEDHSPGVRMTTYLAFMAALSVCARAHACVYRVAVRFPHSAVGRELSCLPTAQPGRA